MNIVLIEEQAEGVAQGMIERVAQAKVHIKWVKYGLAADVYAWAKERLLQGASIYEVYRDFEGQFGARMAAIIAKRKK